MMEVQIQLIHLTPLIPQTILAQLMILMTALLLMVSGQVMTFKTLRTIMRLLMVKSMEPVQSHQGESHLLEI